MKPESYAVTLAPEAAPSRETRISLGRNRLLGLLPPQDFSLLAGSCRDVELERGKVLQEIDEEIEFVYLPHGGMISLLVTTRGGESVETATVGSEGAVNLSAGLGSRIALSRAVVQLPGTAAKISAQRFAALAEQSPILRGLIVRYNDAMIAQTQQSVACNALHDVEARLCRWLLLARDRVGGDTLPLTQEFLSQVLGVRRTTVTLVARLLQNAGIIYYRRGLIRIRDAVALEEAACECYHAMRRQLERIEQP